VSTPPLIYLALAFSLGIALPVDPHPLSVSLSGAALLIFAVRSRRTLWPLPLAFGAYVLLGLGARGLERGVETDLVELYGRLGEKRFRGPCYITGWLRHEPETRADVSLLRIDVDHLLVARTSMSTRGGLSVAVRGHRRERLERFATGDRIGLWGTLRLPAGFVNPGGDDLAGRLERQGIVAFASVKSARLVEVLEAPPPIVSLASRLRRGALLRLGSALARWGADDEVYAVLSALVVGDRSQLPSELERRYQRAGVFHVMAISGAHVALLVVFLHVVLRRVGLDEVPCLVLLLVLLPLYAIFCGGRPPVVRAVVMAIAFIGARLLSLSTHRGNTVALAGLALLVWRPSVLFDAGFQLTFSAVTAIVFLTEPLQIRLARSGILAKPLAISIAAQLGVIPLSAWHFHRLTLLAPLASLLAVPLAAGLVVMGFALVLCSDVPLLTFLLVRIAEIGVELLSTVARVGAEIPWASLRVPQPSSLWIVTYTVTLVACRSLAGLGAAAATIGVGALVAALAWPGAPPKGHFVMTALDVGHGDALSLSLPEGRTVLVDGGGLPGSSLDIGERVVLPFLLDRSLGRVDVALLTHADFDHIGGLMRLIEEIPVGEIWGGSPSWDNRAYRVLRKNAMRRKIPFRQLRAGETFSWGGVDWEILAAGRTNAISRERSTNDQSVVFRITYGLNRALFMGDAERVLEEGLLDRPGPGRLGADVLKVAHHGSKSSTIPAFLLAVDPRFAVISARRRSSWRLPSPRVLHRLEAHGIEYARTDRDGAVTIELHPDGRFEVTTSRSLAVSPPARAPRARRARNPPPSSLKPSNEPPGNENAH
jgi:competence protein ComEC